MITSVTNLRELLKEREMETTVFFENPDYVSAIVGISDDDRLIYSYDKMIEHLKTVDGMDDEEAMEFIDYNTIRALPYAGEKRPIVLFEDFVEGC